MRMNTRFRWFGVVVVLGLLGPALGAVERRLEITAPAEVSAGTTVSVVVAAATDAGGGERIGFFQVEFRPAEDAEWIPLAYVDNIGTEHRQEFALTAERDGVLRVRARVAFRDGLAGDVDQSGAAIRWHDTWADWREPAARHAAVWVRPAGGSD